MLYAIHMRNVERFVGDSHDIVYLVSSVGMVQELDLSFVFTDGSAAVPSLTRFFNDPARLSEVDWSLMRDRYWSNTVDDNDRTRRRQAEFLVRDGFPWDAFSEIATHSDQVKSKVAVILAAHPERAQHPIQVRAGWYY